MFVDLKVLCLSLNFSFHLVSEFCTLYHKLISYSWFLCRLDFGNYAPLFNLPQTKLSRLQKLQHAATYIITLYKKYTRFTLFCNYFIGYNRIVFKILLLNFSLWCKGSSPHYDMSSVHSPVIILRSSNSGSLVVSKSLGERAFAHASPTLWNNISSLLSLRIKNDIFVAPMHLLSIVLL